MKRNRSSKKEDLHGKIKKRKSKHGDPLRFAKVAAHEIECAESAEECIIWPFTACSARGEPPYGNVRYKGKKQQAHRLVLTWAKGPPPRPKSMACHGPCNNTLCINPHHLYWGTAKTNNGKDKKRDGTLAKGENHGKAKLKAEQVREIRVLCAAGNITTRELAQQYGVSPSAILNIVKHKVWTHVDGPKQTRDIRAKLKEEQVREIRALYESGGISPTELAKKYNVSPRTIRDIIKFKSWKHVKK